MLSLLYLIRLQLMDLSCNPLTDLPVELFDLPSLQKLNLSHNQLSCLYLKNSETEQRMLTYSDIFLSFSLCSMAISAPEFTLKC